MSRLLVVLCFSYLLVQPVQAQRTVTGSPRLSLPRPEAANPEQDCMRAIGHHDLRFVGVAGFALDVPGVPDYQTRYWKTNGIKVITGTSDVSDRAFNKAARDYARRYNAQLLKHLATHKSKKDLTERCSEPLAVLRSSLC